MSKEEWLNQKDIYTGISLREAMRQRIPFTRYFTGAPTRVPITGKKAGKLSLKARAQINEMRAAADEKMI